MFIVYCSLKKCCRRPVSRVLSLCGHLSRIPIARDLKRLYPEGRRAASSPPAESCSRWGLAGRRVSTPPVGSYRHLFIVAQVFRCSGVQVFGNPEHPNTRTPEHLNTWAVCFLCHFPSGHPARTLSGIVALRSPDFPPRITAGRPPDLLQPCILSKMPPVSNRAIELWQSLSRTFHSGSRAALPSPDS